MRLTCPSCGAQYEVDDSVIPEAGRDVQCSNCGHAWFQVSASQLKAQAERAAATAEAAPEATVAWTDDDAAQPAATDAATAALPADPPGAVDAGGAGAALAAMPPEAAPEPADEPEPATAPEPQWKSRRKTLDDAVMNVLREEADRELRVRAAEGSLSETQPDPGAAAAAAVATVVAAPSDDGESPQVFSADDNAIVSRASRRELLPDIEEINSTLRATSDRGGEAASVDAPETLRRRRSGFRMGFSTSLLIAVLLLLLYVLAPVIAEKVPASATAMAAYVGLIDSARAWLDTTLRGLTESMRGDGG